MKIFIGLLGVGLLACVAFFGWLHNSRQAQQIAKQVANEATVKHNQEIHADAEHAFRMQQIQEQIKAEKAIGKKLQAQIKAAKTYDQAADECRDQLYDKSQDVHICVKNRLKLSDAKYFDLLAMANR